jgi:hypothetical protein
LELPLFELAEEAEFVLGENAQENGFEFFLSSESAQLLSSSEMKAEAFLEQSLREIFWECLVG